MKILYVMLIKLAFICSHMNGPRDYRTKWSKSDRKRQISYDITYMWCLKCDITEFIYKTEIDSQTWKINLWILMGKGCGRDKLEV